MGATTLALQIGRCAGSVIRFLVLASAVSTASAQAVLAPLPAGATLPVLLVHTLDARHAHPGDGIKGVLSQRVPLEGRQYLPQGTTLLGRISMVSATRLGIAWTTLSLHHRSEPLMVRLIAAADWLDVSSSKDPLGGPSHSTSDWVVQQIGGDEIYGVNVATPVYNRYSEVVGRADANGVYAPPLRKGLPDRAMGPFSTSSVGLYDLPAFTIVSAGPGTIVLGVREPQWRIRAGSALLLEVASP